MVCYSISQTGFPICLASACVLNCVNLPQGSSFGLGTMCFLESYKVRACCQMPTNPCMLLRFERLAVGGIRYRSGLCPAVPPLCPALTTTSLFPGVPLHPMSLQQFWLSFSPSSALFESCILGLEEERGAHTPVASHLFNNSSFNQPAASGNLHMRLSLLENS